ncbi:MAG TPA: Hpt domain-containing protein, partial [Albitalea sp.]|nr:Hpt domain-containing protein [Albitalea sp.]
MTQDDESFLARLLATFKVEAQEHLAAMSAELVALERPAPDAEVPARVETLFREAHSLKGAARSVNLADVERVCQALERVLSAVKRNQLALSPVLYDTVYATLDLLGQLLARDVEGKPLGGAAPLLVAQIDALDALLQPRAEQPRAPYPAARSQPQAAAPEPAAAPAGDTVRIATAKLELLLAQVEELHAHKFASGQLADELQALSRSLHEWRRQWDKRARTARATRRSLARPGGDTGAGSRQALQWLESVDSDELFATTLADRLAQIERDAAQQRRVLTARVDKLMDGVKQALMLPFATLFEPLPKIVREKVERLGGRITLASTPGQGTRFTMLLPNTLATFRGLLVS